MAKFNYASERKKLEAKWLILRVEYANAGMPQEGIDEMYRFDLDELNSNRRFANRTTELGGLDDEYEVGTICIDAYAHYDSYLFGNPRYEWIEDVKNEQLYNKLIELKIDDLELLTLYTVEQFTQTVIARKYGISQKNISKKIKRILNFLSQGV